MTDETHHEPTIILPTGATVSQLACDTLADLRMHGIGAILTADEDGVMLTAADAPHADARFMVECVERELVELLKAEAPIA